MKISSGRETCIKARGKVLCVQLYAGKLSHVCFRVENERSALELFIAKRPWS